MFRAKYNKIEKIWGSDEAPFVFNSNVSLGHLLLRSMDLCASKMSQVYHFETIFSNNFNFFNFNFV